MNSASPTAWVPVDLAIVIPTFKEKDNVEPLLDLLAQTMQGISYEVIFVDDDSPDGTADLVRRIGRENPRVRVLQRIGRRGLSSACLEGMMSTGAPYIAVMDADLQHDERILPAMLAKAQTDSLDLVVATRNAAGGSMGAFSASRVRLSQLGRRLSYLATRCELSDPMSGFFLLDRRFLEEVVHAASGVGFKILLDLVASSERTVRFAEVAYTFRTRLRGESKLDILVGLEYLQLLLDKFFGHIIPARYFLFASVGALGVVLHLALLKAFRDFLGQPFFQAQLTAAFLVMTFNFLLNNITTYRDYRLKGMNLFWGLLKFYAGCSIGLVINGEIAASLLRSQWPTAWAALAGLIVGSVWNYGVSSFLTWRHGLWLTDHKKRLRSIANQ